MEQTANTKRNIVLNVLDSVERSSLGQRKEGASYSKISKYQEEQGHTN